MKKITVFSSIVAGLILQGQTSQALVERLGVCQTTNGNYQIVVYNNQGIGTDRDTTNLGVEIYDSQGQQQAQYAVETRHIGSVSFGRKHYMDTAEHGQKFDLALGSTNFHNVYVKADLNNGDTLVENNLECHK